MNTMNIAILQYLTDVVNGECSPPGVIPSSKPFPCEADGLGDDHKYVRSKSALLDRQERDGAFIFDSTSVVHAREGRDPHREAVYF